MLRTVTESVRELTHADFAYVVRSAPHGPELEVVESAGSGAPAQYEMIRALPLSAPPGRLVLPLSLDGMHLGVLVADGISIAPTPESERELELLTAMAALALQNQVLVVETQRLAVQQAERQFRLLSGTIYHLKNTLAIASEYSQLLQLDDEVSDGQREYLRRSQRSIATALRLLSELHELGRTETGDVVLQREPLNVVALIRDILRDYRLSTATTGIRFDLETPFVPLINTDPDCVRQVVDTLLSNAVRYSPADAQITVKLSVRSGRRAGDPAQWLRIDVNDSGPGVAEREAVFEEIQRVERKGPPGFRLAISRRIARLLGGDLTLETGRDSGSTFSLWLPLGGEEP
jgi:signal transduction histidine kinase